MKKGFTLIELLVVVLIIGILSAVALPQYQKAVFKARLTQMDVIFNTLTKGITTWALSNPGESAIFTGESPTGVLDIELPTTGADSQVSCMEKFGWYLECMGEMCIISGGPTKNNICSGEETDWGIGWISNDGGKNWAIIAVTYPRASETEKKVLCQWARERYNYICPAS